MKKKIDENNIYENGMLLVLKCGAYEGIKKMSKEQLKDFPTEIVRGSFDLFDNEFKEKIKKINSYVGTVRSEVYENSIPIEIDGVHFLPAKKIRKVMEFIEEKKQERTVLVEEVVKEYVEAIERYKEKYPEYYELGKSRYITEEEFKNKFYFRHRLLRIEAPNKSSFITPEMYKEEVQKFKDSVNSMKKEVCAIIYHELLDMTEKLKKQCKDGRPNQGTINSVNKFLSQIDEVYSGFIDRQDIQKLVNDVRASLFGVDADKLRDSDQAKNKLEKALKSIAKDIKAIPDVPPKRAIDF